MRTSVLFALLAVGGCTLNDNQRDEVSEIASAEARDAVAESQRVQYLEERIDDIEYRLDQRGIY